MKRIFHSPAKRPTFEANTPPVDQPELITNHEIGEFQDEFVQNHIFDAGDPACEPLDDPFDEFEAYGINEIDVELWERVETLERRLGH